MKRILLAILISLVAAHADAASVLNGRIYNIDGDGDNAVDDSKISRIQFDVTAGTSVFFDSLVFESLDLNGDGFVTRFDNEMKLFSGSTLLDSIDDSNLTYGDGSTSSLDSAMSFSFDTAGTYLITLGEYGYSEAAALLGYRADRVLNDQVKGQTFGAWRLTMTASDGSLSNVIELDDPQSATVPEPTTIALMALGFVGMGYLQRRRKPLQA